MNKRNLAIAAALSLCVAAPGWAATFRMAAPTERLNPALRVLPLPDLVIRTASIRRARDCRWGAPALYVTARVSNIGHATSAAKTNVGMVQARETGGVNWGNGHGLPALAPGETTSVTFPIYYLQSHPAHMLGTHSFKLTVNAGGWIHESNTANNAYGPVTVTLPPGSCGLRPDITSHKGVRIGGKYVPWGGSVTLGRSNAKRINKQDTNMCVFDLYYPMVNDGKVETHPDFVNRLRDGVMLAAVQSGLHLKAGETQTIRTEPTLLLGTHMLSVSLDDGNAVAESNEHNNLFRVRVTVDDSCRKGGSDVTHGPLPDITSSKGIKIGGKTVPWGGSVTLGRKDAKRIDNAGVRATSAGTNICVFDLYYPMVNKGSVPTNPAFKNQLREGNSPVALQPGLHLNAGQSQLIRTEPSLLLGQHVLSFSLDDGNAVAESNEHNNLFHVTVNVDNSCRKGMAHRPGLPLKMIARPHLQLRR